MEYRLQLTGWQAAAVGAVILGVVTYQCVARIQHVDDAGRETLRAWFAKEYQGKGLRQEVQAYLRRKAGEEPAPAQAPTPEPSVRFVSLDAHGWKDIMIVRAQVRVNDGPPPDGRSIRYVYLDRQPDGRFMVFGDTDALHYYWTLLSPVFSRSSSVAR